MSRRGSAMLSVGLHRMLALPVTMPVPRMVEALNAFGPDCLHVYPSMAVLLADEKRAGRLRRGAGGRHHLERAVHARDGRAIEDAFGVRPLDLYASTEGLWGAACGEGRGHHLFEDLAIVENVDEDGRPVPDGERGARVLVTNLVNLAQPLIRFEVTDVVTIDPEPCPCGRTLRRMRSVEGRADAVLRLPGAAGERIPVHPLQFGVITADRGVREFQVVQRGDGVRVRVVAREGERPERWPSGCASAWATGWRRSACATRTSRWSRARRSSARPRASCSSSWPRARSERPPRLRRVSSSVQHVRIREVGPRDGFQNEPEVIATADKVRLIELLARTGLKRLEVTSFVRADVIPQLADAREVLEAIDVPDDVSLSVLIPNERGLDNALELRDRFHEVNVFMSATESHNQANVNRSVEESLTGPGGRARPRPRGGPALRGRDLRRLRLPLRGPRRLPERVFRDREAADRGGRAGDRLRRHDRDGQPGPGPLLLPGRARRARGRRRADRALPQHAGRGSRTCSPRSTPA